MAPVDGISKVHPSLPESLPPRQHEAGKLTFHEKVLAVLAQRQQVLASNIANADTPNYKAVDIDIDAVFNEVKAGRGPLRLLTASTGHLVGEPASGTPRSPIKYRIPLQPSLDGNTVDMQSEQARFAENVLRYQFTLDRVGGRYKMMRELLNDLV